jgi:hypothetical protein
VSKSDLARSLMSFFCSFSALISAIFCLFMYSFSLQSAEKERERERERERENQCTNVRTREE